jgi:hypothetical protein
MAALSLASGPSLSLQLQLERADRAQRDEFAAGLARRMRDVPLPPRHTRTTVRPLAWPVWVGGVQCVCVVTVYSITPRPRSHSTERYWFPSIQEARAKFPQAQLLDDAPRVAPRLPPPTPVKPENRSPTLRVELQQVRTPRRSPPGEEPNRSARA